MMPFSTSKCTVMHLGCHNRNHHYAMDGNHITSIRARAHWPLCLATGGRIFVAGIFIPVGNHYFQALASTLQFVSQVCDRLWLVPATDRAFCGCVPFSNNNFLCRPSVLGSTTKTRPPVAKQSGQCAQVLSLQRGLGILISSDLRWDHQVKESCKKASKVLGMIARNFMYKTRNIILPFYKTLKRPHLEYGANNILGHDLEETPRANGAYPAPCYKTYIT